MDTKEHGRASLHKTERVNSEIIEYSIVSITYCTIAWSTEMNLGLHLRECADLSRSDCPAHKKAPEKGLF